VTQFQSEILTDFPIAHRGFFNNSGVYPENSAGAVVDAVHRGFASEMDVMLSADGEVVLFHDDTLARVCGATSSVADLTCAELAGQRLFNSNEVIPTLASVLERVRGVRPLIIELKSFTASGFQVDGRLERAVIKTLSHYSGPVALKSFNPHTVEELLRLRSSRQRWPIGFISCDHSKDQDFGFLTVQAAAELAQVPDELVQSCDFFSYNINDLNDPLSRRLRAHGPLMVWTVRTPEQYEKATRLADNIVFEWRGVQAEKFGT
jgi:glycerophosphoryl diester phosphodiesterase